MKALLLFFLLLPFCMKAQHNDNGCEPVKYTSFGAMMTFPKETGDLVGFHLARNYQTSWEPLLAGLGVDALYWDQTNRFSFLPVSGYLTLIPSVNYFSPMLVASCGYNFLKPHQGFVLSASGGFVYGNVTMLSGVSSFRIRENGFSAFTVRSFVMF